MEPGFLKVKSFMQIFDRVYRIINYRNIYLIDGGKELVLIDCGTHDLVETNLKKIKKEGFLLEDIKLIIVSHAHADHVGGLAKDKSILGCPVAAHKDAVRPIEEGDKIVTCAEIKAAGYFDVFPPCKIDNVLKGGERIKIGDVTLGIIHTPGHTPGSIAIKLGNILITGDTIYKDSGVGFIDCHHGSNLDDYIKSLRKIRDSSAEYILPTHGPWFKNDPKILNEAIKRLSGYKTLSDFGVLCTKWRLEERYLEQSHFSHCKLF